MLTPIQNNQQFFKRRIQSSTDFNTKSTFQSSPLKPKDKYFLKIGQNNRRSIIFKQQEQQNKELTGLQSYLPIDHDDYYKCQNFNNQSSNISYKSSSSTITCKQKRCKRNTSNYVYEALQFDPLKKQQQYQCTVSPQCQIF